MKYSHISSIFEARKRRKTWKVVFVSRALLVNDTKSRTDGLKAIFGLGFIPAQLLPFIKRELNKGYYDRKLRGEKKSEKNVKSTQNGNKKALRK